MTVEASDKLKELMNLINVYVDGLVGRNNPDYEDICQDAYIEAIYYLDRKATYSAAYIFREDVKGTIQKNIDKNYSHLNEVSEEYAEKIGYIMGSIIGHKMLSEDLGRIISTLTPREQKVLYLRFFEEKNLDETGRYFNVTRERIRQIEAKALRKLRHPTRSKLLKEYMRDIDTINGDNMSVFEEDDSEEDIDN